MKRTSFNDGWQYREKVNPFAELAGISAPFEDIALPHDAQISRARDPEGDRAVAFFPPGAYQYRKTFTVPSEFDGKRLVLEFEGVYRDATVHINGNFAGHRAYGYSGFAIDADTHLRPGEENTIEVEARNGEDSRWYTGAGIYRNVWLHVGSEVHIPVDGVKVTTPDIEADAAIVEVAVTVANTRNRRATVSVSVSIADSSGATVATGTVPVSVEANGSALSRQRLRVEAPALWSAETPALYSAHAELSDEVVIDEAHSSFGIRKLQVDPVRGLRVNGHMVKLRGACIHHDNGILGAATFGAAEERRVRLLKEAGFNAIRSAHNPISVGLLEACDRLGMYVMDETFDMWTSGKMPHDYSLHFTEWWERDVEAMVVKDFNHPSVILYSIGNEIPETGSPAGGITGRALAEKIRALDPTRFVTNAVNGLLAVMDDLKAMGAQSDGSPDEEVGINTMMASGPGAFMNKIGSSPLVTEKTAESFGLLDIAGMNYLDARYVMDRELFPNRVIVGTETFPTHIDNNWGLVTDNAHVIGDFTWTGFDYLGEVGIGAPQYLAEGEQPTLSVDFPWIAAWCGDLDLIGDRRPASFYREIVFGLRSEPYIAVNRPGREGTFYAGPWTWSDSLASWTWSGHENALLTVEVYSDADEVELALNGEVIGTSAAGRDHAYRAEFPVAYTPGTLVATAIRNGVRAESHTLFTAGPAVQLLAGVDAETADGIRFVRIGIADSDGRIVSGADRLVTVELEGEGRLVAVGSGNPAPADSYVSAQHTSFDGRALAVVQVARDATVGVTISADGLTAARLSLTAGEMEILDSEKSLSAAR